MKFHLLFICFFISFASRSQTPSELDFVGINGKLSSDKSIIYGNFIQRLGFSSGGFPQSISIVNLETNESYVFIVKPAMKTSKENKFCYYIKPGHYAIVNYIWYKSKMYGAEIFTEPIIKGIDTSTDEFKEKVKKGEIKEEDLIMFTFKIEPNSLNYLGTWHFNTGLVKFTDDKIDFDAKLKTKYPGIDFNNSITNLPE
ncbi:MAG TPA: hypothetical protein VLB74_04060 [Flavobacterium sp.]|uniref:hypothetical protein n=1 Tax=Flavobacterium sp. TaxID=239 RepID=UPI002D07FC03|nr:hypothetical protein [Flavobacterium sp.]HSD13801.1 hypothetical protein [Flavobacterium sp.]